MLGVTIFYGISKYPNIHLLRKRLKYFFSIQKPDSIVDACQALSKARELRAQFEKKEKPLITAKVEIHIASKYIYIFLNNFTPLTTNHN